MHPIVAFFSTYIHSMISKNKVQSFLLLLILITVTSINSFAQWNDKYGNEWINYTQQYVRIGVVTKGIQKVLVSSLPSGFPKNDPGKFQLWHRGQEVTIISASANEIIFYGEPNDGASDSLVYRPSTDRLNPYVSLFSDIGSYFLTVANGARRNSVVDGSSISGEPLRYHLQKDIFKFTNQFAFSTFDTGNALNNSFYESMNTWTSATSAGVNDTSGVKLKEILAPFVLNKLVGAGTVKPVLEVLVSGLSESAHDIQILSGKSVSNTDLRLLGSFPFFSWGAKKGSFELSEADINADMSGMIKIKSVAANVLDWFGLAYYTITYPQATDMQNKSSYTFNLAGVSTNSNFVSIANAPNNVTAYDITNPHNPIAIAGKYSSGTFDVMVPKSPNRILKLFVSSPADYQSVAPGNITPVNFKPVYSNPAISAVGPIDPSAYDYLIITNNNLETGVIKYAEYRSSNKGGMHKTLVMNIRDVYDQFNYGEPSPVAIRRFCNYMLKNGVRETKHNLFLVGPSVTIPVNLAKEMPNEIPSFGDPGSDILLVAGLQNHHQDVPAIPVGRLVAFTPAEVISYLAKVESYEHETDIGWRKNILHLNGGHSASEITLLKNLLSTLNPIVEKGELGGKVTPFVKQNPGTTEPVNIAPEVNNGVGMITYFGHGAQTITDLDMGLVSDASRGYQDAGKYSLMYFNGCGVGNIFTSRSRNFLAGNWLATPNRGAISIIANSYKSYIGTSSAHLTFLYTTLFGNTTHYSIGQVVKEVAKKVVNDSPGSLEVANIHQSNLMGDPALYLIRVENADFAVDGDESIMLYSESPNVSLGNSKNLTASVIVSNNGKYIKEQSIPVTIKYLYKDGTTETKNQSMDAIPYKDTLSFTFPNKKNISSVQVTIDPGNTIVELNKSNNFSELIVDWEVAKNQVFYPTGTGKDMIAPLLNITFNSRSIKNDETVEPNPFMSFVLTDDRAIPADTSLIDIYLKTCEDANCTFKRLSYSINKLNLIAVSSNSIRVSYNPEFITEGNYELLVNVKDKIGNTPASPYNIRFKVKELGAGVKVVSSPNPTSDYVHFEVNVDDNKRLKSYRWLIYNAKGIIEFDKSNTLSTEGIPDWYWYPKRASGVYIYKLIFYDANGNEENVSGRISVIK